VSQEHDHVRTIADRIAGHLTARGPAVPSGGTRQDSGELGQELSAIRSGLHELERKLDRIESSLSQSPALSGSAPRARVIDYISAPAASVNASPFESPASAPRTQSPWLGSLHAGFAATAPPHASQERFGVEEASVAELVEFFENEKKCTVEPGGKPCDHCAMCSSRGF
jgi:hypothetical protein